MLASTASVLPRRGSSVIFRRTTIGPRSTPMVPATLWFGSTYRQWGMERRNGARNTYAPLRPVPSPLPRRAETSLPPDATAAESTGNPAEDAPVARRRRPRRGLQPRSRRDAPLHDLEQGVRRHGGRGRAALPARLLRAPRVDRRRDRGSRARDPSPTRGRPGRG